MTESASEAPIWYASVTLEDLAQLAQGNMVAHLGIEYIDVGHDFLTARMPVDARTKQPFGLLHGGASVALAETVASTASNLCVDPNKYACVGLEINANHIRSVRSGYVVGTARPLHLGRSTQVWDVRILDHLGQKVCISRTTMAVIPR